ncbi:Hsp70 family protein [Anthocerotibacter panamensis]|uniref:Hsp70 family protein n=1 Tax=Anthocerotibacter panamensis TaxID=2857077 RepID=UPI001C4044E1|nr:Hsp70 family protein [Anthocerotibacter panamensis]
MTTVVGIDLGTTNSALAYVNTYGKPEVIPNSEGERITPSVVFFDGDLVIVGQTALEAAVTHPQAVVAGIKRQMGKGEFSYTAPSGQGYSPEQISAFILKKLKQDAEQTLGPLSDCVITVPAYFDDLRRRATIAAGELAGWKVLHVLNEPTAAAVCYGLTQAGLDQTLLVYDLGGGTFDVTVLKVVGSSVIVLATGGNPLLGGRDFDQLLVDHCREAFIEQTGVDPSDDPSTHNDWLRRVERAKRDLSQRQRTSVALSGGGHTTRIDLTRAQFEASASALLAETLDLCEETLSECRLGWQDLDLVLLVGGSTRMPMVTQLITGLTGKPPHTPVNPDEAVALGAALTAVSEAIRQHPEAVKSLNGMTETMALRLGGRTRIEDVTSHSLGILAYVGPHAIHDILVPKNTPVPVEIKRQYKTQYDNQVSLEVPILQGEATDPALCVRLGELRIEGLPPRPEGAPVQVTMRYTRDGTVEVEALDIQANKQARARIDRSKQGLDPRQLAQAQVEMAHLQVE